MTSKIKFIFTNTILTNSLNSIKTYFNNQHMIHLSNSINKFLACGDISKGFITHRCHMCNFKHKMKLTCKSRLCNSCGYNYSVKWTNSILNQLINIPHRHVLFTIPKQFRKFIAYDRTILSKLAADINNIFKYLFNNIHDKNKRKIYIPKSSDKYFTDSDIIHYGLITVIHTFGRDLKFNPHIHAIVSLGGFNKHYQYKKFKYFHVPSIANQWRYLVCRALNQGNYPNDTIKKEALDMASKMYKEDVRFFFNVGDNNVNNPKGIIKYLGRYLARVPIAEYKIVDINIKKNFVTFMFNDLANNKEITYHTLTIQDFVSKLLFHLPYKHFKMINRFGFYARRKSDKLKSALALFKTELKKVLLLFRKNFKAIWEFDPFMCPNCNIYLEAYELFVSSAFGRPIHKFYNPNGLLFK